MENAPPLRPNSPLAQAKRLVILRFDKLGDTILALPCLRWLERHLPTAQTTIVASPLGVPVLAREKSEVKIFEPQSNNLQADLGAYLKSQDFDILFCFTEKGFALKASGQSQIPHRYGFTPGLHNPVRALSVNWQLTTSLPNPSANPKINEHRHEVERFFSLLEAAGATYNPPLPPLTLPSDFKEEEAARERLQSLLQGLGKEPSTFTCALQLMPRLSKFIGTPRLNYEEHLGFIIKLYGLLLEARVQPLFTLAPGDRSWALPFLAYLQEKLNLPHLPPLFCEPDLFQTVAFLKNLSLMVTPLGGSTHLAAAAQIPVVWIIEERTATTEMSRWHPYQTPNQPVIREEDQPQDGERLWHNLYEACLAYVYQNQRSNAHL